MLGGCPEETDRGQDLARRGTLFESQRDIRYLHRLLLPCKRHKQALHVFDAQELL